MGGKNHIYITTTLPYVNADPHVGFAMEVIRADALARYYRARGDEVFLNTGTDEHGAKIYEAAIKDDLPPQVYADHCAEKFRELKGLLNLSVDNFVRTTDAHHVMAAQEFWKRCDANGDIYKKFYKIKYCTGCELEKTDSELDENGRCPIHSNRELDVREEENYFFRFSNYTEKLKDLYEKNPTFVVPDFRGNEMRAFAERGFEDFSISRLKTKMPWGVAVPGDDAHVMYVWFDALVNYVSAIGWPACAAGAAGRPDHRCGEDSPERCAFTKWWPVIQYCGKDNNRQQSAMWQAMLMSAKLPPSKHIIIDGFINSGGQKMSKSLGNVINPFEVIEAFKGVTDFPEDVLRFVLLHDMPSFEDGDLTMDSIKTSYATHLQNGIGNLTSRIMKMATVNSIKYQVSSIKYGEEYQNAFAHFDLHKAIGFIWDEISALDKDIQEKEPFKVVKVDKEKGAALIVEMVQHLSRIAVLLKPFLPRTGEEIERLIHEHKMPEKPLFGRLGQ